MTFLLRMLGRMAYWLGWPFFRLYFKWGGHRTRLLLVCDDKILLVKGWISDGLWGMPGGGLHRGEDPLQGLLREVQEEAGVALASKDVRLVGAYDYHLHGYRYPYHLFVAQVSAELPTQAQWHEIADVAWVDHQTLTSRNARPDVLRAVAYWWDQSSSSR